jgi:hypothetical protein
LNQAPSAAKPVTEKTDEDLTQNDTDDFEIGNGLLPNGLTNCLVVPAIRECSFEEWYYISN